MFIVIRVDRSCVFPYTVLRIICLLCTVLCPLAYTIPVHMRASITCMRLLCWVSVMLYPTPNTRSNSPSPPHQCTTRKRGWYAWKPSSSSIVSSRALRVYPLVEVRQTVCRRKVRGDSISISSILPPLNLIGALRLPSSLDNPLRQSCDQRHSPT